MSHWFEGPLLFLDIDGVLNSIAYAKRQMAAGERWGGVYGIDREAVPHLQRIVDETGCSLILSSTWRLGPPGQLSKVRGLLIEAGMRHPCPLRDRTPDLSEQYRNWEDRKRGREVENWIETRGYEGRYVCVDDDSDFLPHQPLVKTSSETGLMAEHADRCIAILRGRQ